MLSKLGIQKSLCTLTKDLNVLQFFRFSICQAHDTGNIPGNFKYSVFVSLEFWACVTTLWPRSFHNSVLSVIVKHSALLIFVPCTVLIGISTCCLLLWWIQRNICSADSPSFSLSFCLSSSRKSVHLGKLSAFLLCNIFRLASRSIELQHVPSLDVRVLPFSLK